MLGTQYQLCPIFSNMFSELPHYPRYQLIRRHHSPKLPVSVQQFTITTHRSHRTHRKPKIDIVGVDRYKFFQIPLKRNNLLENRSVQPAIVEDNLETNKTRKYCTKKVQTKYRESSAQTAPWEPSFVITKGTDPELLKIDFLKYGSGLPVGVHEAEIIERARIKRAWQQYFEQNDNLQETIGVLGAIERDEWIFREREIQDVQDLRLALLEDMLNELQVKCVKRSELKTRKFAEIKEIEKNEKLRQLQKRTERELRKIQLKEMGINVKSFEYRSMVGDKPQIGLGAKDCLKHFNNRSNLYQPEFSDIANLDTLPKWLDQATIIKDCCCLKLPGTHLCVRETKWTGPVLKELHQELENLRVKKQEKQFKQITVSVQSSESILNTPEVEGIPDWEEECFQSVITLQSIIKGRAPQSLVYEGRERCRQLIKELKYNNSLLEEQKQKIRNKKIQIKLNHRKERLEYDKLMKLQENLRMLQGSIVGTLLDFLNKKLQRLLEERRIHAICLMLERERKRSDATDDQQKEQDEIFGKSLGIDEPVEEYLENIIIENMNRKSNEEAKARIKKLLQKIENETFETLIKRTSLEKNEEQIVRLSTEIEDTIHKEVDRLKSVHDIVYSVHCLEA